MRGREVLGSPQVVRDFLRVRLGGLEHEVFAALMLDAQHALIEYVELFRGTVSQTSVYPREVVKESLARNAAAVILDVVEACLAHREADRVRRAYHRAKFTAERRALMSAWAEYLSHSADVVPLRA